MSELDKDGESNEELVIFLTMMSQTRNCLPETPVIIDKPAPPLNTIYRTFSVNPQTGERKLISESHDGAGYEGYKDGTGYNYGYIIDQ